MALQLTGAAKAASVANLQVRLPIVVIGGGLTAIDTATEALAYYPVQVEKFLDRYATLVVEQGADAVHAAWTPHEREVAEEFLAHARAIRAERSAAKAERRAPRILALLLQWGGGTIAYRRRLEEAPSYTGNHEEVAKGLEEGITFAENVTPVAVELDAFGHAAALRARQVSSDAAGNATTAEIVLRARTILVAAGTQSNTVLGRKTPVRSRSMDDTSGRSTSWEPPSRRNASASRPKRMC